MPRRPCRYCQAPARHPAFAFLIASPHSSSWDFSRHPLWKLRCHNRDRRFVRGQKSTKQGAPNHRIVIVIGPFYEYACLFVHTMKSSSRKYSNRLARGVLLARMWHHLAVGSRPLHVWCSDKTQRATVAAQLSNTDESAQRQMAGMAASVLREMRRMRAAQA